MVGSGVYGRARWLLTGLLITLLVALAVAVTVTVSWFGDGGTGQTSAAPLIGRDHWHATYQVVICGERQPNFPTWLGGVHTHDDGIIHIHPFASFEEGRGARLEKWFEYGGGRLSDQDMRMPGSLRTFTNGDKCADGSAAVLQVFVNGEKLDGWEDYIPQDGDRILITFGPE